MREWLISNALAEDTDLDTIEYAAKEFVKQNRNSAWEKYLRPLKEQTFQAANFLQQVGSEHNEQSLEKLAANLLAISEPMRRDIMKALADGMDAAKSSAARSQVKEFYTNLKKEYSSLYDTHLYNEGPKGALKVKAIPATYNSEPENINGFEVLNRYFDELFSVNKKIVAFGEDLGQIGDVNQGFSGLQEKYGRGRIFDSGIRELSIIGQGIGLALRGLRPIAEIQYLDYLLYGLQPLSDDVCTTHYRTVGQQSVPLIVRTRGHRLEGIWHSGSPLGMIINSLRGMYVCVPRNMVQAAGMYNTLFKSNDPAIMIECLNGYRLKEKLPMNLTEFTIPLGVPEVIREGSDITMVSYGSMLRIIQEAAGELKKQNIHCEIIDVQTLLPFDLSHVIVESLQKTNRIVFIDEDVPGGAAAYMFNKVMEEQGGYRWLDVAPRTITAKAHRPAYGSDGDYFSKPNVEDVKHVAQEMMQE